MYTTAKNDSDLERGVMERIGKSWDTRVAVRKERLDLSDYCDPSLPDFPISMVPFWDDEDFAKLDQKAKLRFLAAAWVAYNEKAIYLEDEVINPLCSLLLKGAMPGANDPQVKQVIAQILVDEQFHILMCLDICNNARERHAIEDYVVPVPALGVKLKKSLAEAADDKEYAIIRLAYGSVAEMSINAYLNYVANDTTIQPLNRINTDMHRRDESVHGQAFRQITASIYRRLDDEGKRSFRHHIKDALDDYTSPDITSWASILDYIELPGREKIMAKLEAETRGKRLTRDYTVLEGLFDDLGIKEEVGFGFH
jgi:hypothetical protein